MGQTLSNDARAISNDVAEAEDEFFDAVEYQPPVRRSSRIRQLGGIYRTGSRGVAKAMQYADRPIRYGLKRYPGTVTIGSKTYTREQIYAMIVELKRKEERLMTLVQGISS